MGLFREFGRASNEEKKALKKEAFWLSHKPDQTKNKSFITRVKQKDDNHFTVSYKQAVDQSWFSTDDESKDFGLYASRVQCQDPPAKKAKTTTPSNPASPAPDCAKQAA